MIDLNRHAAGFAEIIDKQNDIIQQQAGIIDELSMLLMLHISADDFSALPVYHRMQQAADRFRGIERGDTSCKFRTF